MTIPFSKIDISARARNPKKHGDLTGFIDSLATIGTIHPLILSHRPLDDRYDLIAGGRRFDALKKLGHSELHHGITLDPQRPGFLFSNEVPLDIRKEAELDENLHRLDMDWIDNVLLIADVHQTKKKKNPKWGQRQTAELLGKGYGKTNVNNAVRVAEFLRSGDKEILSCQSLMDALSVLVKRKEDEALAELQKRVTPKGPPALPTSTGTDSFLDKINIVLSPNKGMAVAAQAAAVEQAKLEESRPPVEVPLSHMFRLGDCLEIMKSFDEGSFSHVVTDIPYGIDMKNLDEKLVVDVKEQHNVQQNVDMMWPFLEQAFRLTAPGGFCVFFYDLDHHEKLQGFAGDVGFRVQRWPFIACKTSACANNAAQYNTTKNYECFMLLRKDSHTVLRKAVNTSWKTYNFAAERQLYNNPFAKPFELWKDIYDAIAFPGQTILDPFVGECSSARAAANCGLVPYGFEINEKHLNRGLEHMKAVYALIHKSNVRFT